MLKKILLYLILAAVSIINAGELVKVAKVKLGDSSQRNFIESLQLRIIDLNNETLTTLLNRQNEEELSKKGLSVDFLSNPINEDEIYLVNINRKINKESSIDKNEVLLKSGNNFVVKSGDNKLSLQPGVIAIPVLEINNIYRNEKTIYNSIQSDALDSLISNVVVNVNAASVENYIQGLQDFGTRYCGNDNRKIVALWIKDQFEAMGYTDVVLDSFQIDTRYFGVTWQYNVVATYPAYDGSENVVIVGGHHDSITSASFSDASSPAPGADDNASGTVAVLETARVLMESNFRSEVNIKFMTFAAEELGLYGSFYYARKAVEENTNIKFMINHDMISSNFNSLENAVIDINYYTGSEIYRDLALDNVEKFTSINGEVGQANSSGSDSYAFHTNGFYAVYFEESQFSPYYHTSQDLITNYDMDFCAEVIKASAATLISGSVAPGSVTNYVLADVGNGTSIYAEWDLSTETDVVSYKVYLGTESGYYTEEFETTGNSFTLENLTEGTEYFVGITAIDTDGYESFIIERNVIPYSIPLPPAQFTALPQWHAVALNWMPNKELDLAGYNVYRSGIDTDEIIKLNTEIITETNFTDNTIESGIFYEYQVKSVDNDQNESANTDYLVSRGVTLDQGILLVDETADGDGSDFSPTDEQVDQFYENALVDFSYSQFDLKTVGKIDLADLGAYNAILWYGDEKSDQNAMDYKDDLREYLDYGGKILYSGYRPSKTFEGITSLTQSFQEGDFLYDCFKIAGVNYSILAKFNGAAPVEFGYYDLLLDQAKVGSNSDMHINGIEVFEPQENGVKIFDYHSDYEPSSPQGSLSGGAVGVEYIGEDFSSVVLSFPLYYIQENSAYNFINYVLGQKFGLMTDVDTDEENIPNTFALMQNYPNPFNPTTKIKFSILHSQFTTLKVFDILGREVKTLVNEVKQPGTYEVEFIAGDLASGIYFYSLKAGEFSAVKKLMLIK